MGNCRVISGVVYRCSHHRLPLQPPQEEQWEEGSSDLNTTPSLVPGTEEVNSQEHAMPDEVDIPVCELDDPPDDGSQGAASLDAGSSDNLGVA